MKIFVVNAGSSSLKYQLIDMDNESVLAKGLCERIGVTGAISHKAADGREYKAENPMPTHSEAFEAVIRFMFDEVGVNRLEARHNVDNPNSGGVMKKCGLTYEGTLRQAATDNTGLMDLSVYSILRSEYEAMG